MNKWRRCKRSLNGTYLAFLPRLILMGLGLGLFGVLPGGVNAAPTTPILLVVYAPFGTDPILTELSIPTTCAILDCPYVAQWQTAVQNPAIELVALIDRYQDDTMLLESGPGGSLQATPWGKRDMTTPQTFIDLMTYIQTNYNYDRLILINEGHGAGYLPHLDRQAGSTAGSRFDAFGNQILDEPVSGLRPLPMRTTSLSGGFLMSTYEWQQALAGGTNGGTTPFDLILFNNCFNLSLELLDTIAPYTQYVAAYGNYNFFTMGVTYPEAFAGVDPTTGTETIARQLMRANEAVLEGGEYPTVGGVVEMANLTAVTTAMDQLALQLIAAIQNGKRDRITQALTDAQKYDTTYNDPADYDLAPPDDLTDVRHLAQQLMRQFEGQSAVFNAAQAVYVATQDIKVYGANGMYQGQPWDFTEDLALNIYFPHPRDNDLWEWRAPYYINPTPGDTQPQIIPFLKNTRWPLFIQAYYQTTPVGGILAPAPPPFLVFGG